jgi:putative ABC transport system permease protein
MHFALDISLDIWEFVKLALIAIKTNKVRALLTMLGIIIGVSSVILLVSIGSGLQAFITQQFASLGSNTIYIMPGKIDFKNSSSAAAAMMSVSKLELSFVTELERNGAGIIKQVTPASATSGFMTYKGKSATSETAGIWENYFSIQSFPLREGKGISQNDVERSRKVIVLGSKPAEDMFGKDINPVGKYMTLNNIRYLVIGWLESKGGGGLGASMDNHVFIPLTTFFKQFNQNKPYMLLIQAVDQNHVSEAADIAKKTLLKHLKDDEFTVMEQKELLNTINQMLSVLTVALGGIASISLLVGGIGIMNIMLVSVTERTREIGLRKAVGATPTAILLQFLIEAVILSLVGGSIGIAIGALGSLALSQFIQSSVTLWSVMLAFGFSSLVGIVFGIAPAIRAAKLNPIDALRYE